MDAKEASERYINKSLEAFLKGEPFCDEKWITGIVKGMSPEAMKNALKPLTGIGSPERLDFLKKASGVA